jgi:ribonuclease III
MAPAKSTRPLEKQLGYRFQDATLLERALTHSSARVQRSQAAGKVDDKLGDNERLEFLGDRVLGLAIAELLSETFTSAVEGELARRFNNLVRGGTCAEVARSWDLGAYIRLSDSEAENGGRDKDTILADACEAVLAAVFLEAGFNVARDVVRLHWSGRLNIQLKEPFTDAKSALQEWAQGQGLPLPCYTEVSREGPDHAPVFTTEVRVDAKRSARGSGASKRIAEQAAATKLLNSAGVWKATT